MNLYEGIPIKFSHNFFFLFSAFLFISLNIGKHYENKVCTTTVEKEEQLKVYLLKDSILVDGATGVTSKLDADDVEGIGI